MDGLKKQLEIVFSMNASTLKMAVEHFKIQQLIIEKNKLKEENATAIQEAVKKYKWKNNKKFKLRLWLTNTGTIKFRCNCNPRSSKEIQLEKQQEI